jgi:hypothetical protein
MAHAVSLTTVQAVIARALSIAPADRSRIGKAAELIAFGQVEQTDATTFAVTSLTDATVTYTVTPNACECLGRVHYPTRRCSHEWAARILLSVEKAQQAQAQQDTRQRASADSVAVAYASAHRRAA